MSDSIRVYPDDQEKQRLNDYVVGHEQGKERNNSEISEQIEESVEYCKAELEENDTYEVEFYTKFALVSMTIHWFHFICGPLVLPLLYKLFGKNILKNMNFYCTRPYFTIDLPPFIWLWISLYLIIIHLDWASYYIPYLATTGTVVFIRTCLVSVKYGYYTKHKWSKMNSMHLSKEELGEQLLIKSWIVIPEKIALRELKHSFLRQHIKADDMWMAFEKPVEDQCFDSIKECAQTLGLRTEELDHNWLPLTIFSSCLVQRVNQSIKTNKQAKIVYIVASLYAFLPIVMNLGAWGFFEDILNPLDLLYIGMNAVISFMYCRGFFLFILTGVYDFSRRKLMMAQCSALVSHIDNKYLYLDRNIGKLDLTNISTILAWYHMRAAFLDFGKRYTLRVFLYSSLILPVCLLVIVGLFLIMFNVLGTEYNFYFVPWLFLTAVVMVILIYMTSSAVSLNKYFAIHRDIFLSHIAQIRRQLKEENQPSVRVLEFVVQKLHQDEVLHPVQILGVTMDSNFITKLFAVGVSGLFAALRVFYIS